MRSGRACGRVGHREDGSGQLLPSPLLAEQKPGAVEQEGATPSPERETQRLRVG